MSTTPATKEEILKGQQDEFKQRLEKQRDQWLQKRGKKVRRTWQAKECKFQ